MLHIKVSKINTFTFSAINTYKRKTTPDAAQDAARIGLCYDRILMTNPNFGKFSVCGGQAICLTQTRNAFLPFAKERMGRYNGFSPVQLFETTKNRPNGLKNIVLISPYSRLKRKGRFIFAKKNTNEMKIFCSVSIGLSGSQQAAGRGNAFTVPFKRGGLPRVFFYLCPLRAAREDGSVGANNFYRSPVETL